MDADTSASLLAAVRNTRDDSAWVRFHSLYAPLLRVWAERVGLGTHDAEDAVQETLVVVAAQLPAFRYDPAEGRFRGWLRVIVTNVLRNRVRKAARVPRTPGNDLLAALAADESEAARAWDLEHDRHVLLGLLDLLSAEFAPATLEAFRRSGLGGESAASAGAALNLSANAVLVAKSRVLHRLRELAAGLADV